MILKFENYQKKQFTDVVVRIAEYSEEVMFEIEYWVDEHIRKIQDNIEVIASWRDLQIDNRGEFYTDANSIYFVKRNSKEKVNQGYFPVTSGIMIEDG